MNCSERIRSLREDCDLTQTQIAKFLSIGQRTYCDYELGKTRIPVDSLIKLARMYNVSMDYISGVSDTKGVFPKEYDVDTFLISARKVSKEADLRRRYEQIAPSLRILPPHRRMCFGESMHTAGRGERSPRHCLDSITIILDR